MAATQACGGVDVAGVGGEHRDVTVAEPISAAADLELILLARAEHHLGPGVGAASAAIARPMPFERPVTSATLPSSDDLHGPEAYRRVGLQRRGVDGRSRG